MNRPSATTRSLTMVAGWSLFLFVVAWLSIAATRSSGGVSLLWPVNAVAIVMVLRGKLGGAGTGIAALLLAITLAHIVGGGTPALSAALAAITVVEVVAITWWMRRHSPDLRQLRGLLLFAGASVVAAAVGGALAGAAFAILTGADWLAVARGWMAADALGLILVVPPMMTVARRHWSTRPATVMIGQTVVTIALSAATTVFVFWQGSDPLLFLLMPCSVFAAFLQRFFGAALCVAVIGALATTATVSGFGPVALHFATHAQHIMFLQGLTAALMMTAMPVAALLHQRDQVLKMSRSRTAQLRLLTENASDMIVRISLDGVRQYVSPASRTILGFEPEEMLGRTPIAEIHADDRARVESTCRSLLDGVSNPMCIYRQQHRDGHYVWLEASYQLTTDDGVPVDFIASVRDISQRQDAEQAALAAQQQVAERERLLEMAEGAAQLGHWRLNVVNQTLSWSREVYRIYGVDPTDAPSLDRALAGYHPDDRGMVSEQVATALESGTPFDFEARIIRADGCVRWVASRGQVEHAPNGQIVGLFGVFQDITRRIEDLAIMRESREAAERSRDAQAIFTATMSHEIRTPLTSILATTVLLRDATSADEHRRHVATLDTSGRLLSKIIDDVLVFSRLDDGQVEPENVAFRVEDVLDTAALIAMAEAERRGITFSLVVDRDTKAVRGDPTRIGRVLTNLLGNAVKFTPHGGVTLTARDEGSGRWRFEVADTGIGIPADRIDAIFRPFIQANSSTTREHGGTGLGLSICRLLVEAMGGRIDVRSTEGDGSRFWFTLPLQQADVANVPEIERGIATPAHALSVLVAEDNETNRYLIARLVEKLGHHVMTVENGAEAVAIVSGRHAAMVDVVLMDIHMPIMDGLSAARAIRSSAGPSNTVPIHALTADLSARRREQAFAAGMTGVLAKPIDLDALSSVLGNASVPSAPAATRPPADDAPFDVTRLTTLERTLGRANRDRLLSLLINEAQTVPKRLRDLAASGDYDLLEMEAHGLRGAAVSIGATGLAAALQRMEAATECRAILPEHVDAIDYHADRTITAARRCVDADRPSEH